MNYHIENLADYDVFVPTIARWLYNEWSKNTFSIGEVERRTFLCLKKEGLPQTFIALTNDRPAGTVSLWYNDLRSRPDLCPYMAALYVEPEHRKTGIGQALQKKSVTAANKAGYEKIYLITDLIGYYEKTGWSFVGEEPLGKGKTTRLYERNTVW